MMRLLRTLQNPFALVAQGFVLGGLIFLATHAETLRAAPASGTAAPTQAAIPPS